MNILIPHKWLLEQLETELIPTKIQEYVSLCGPSIERIYERGNDKVYDIEITTNRVDSMSVRGVAREAAVILGQFDIPAKLAKQNLTLKNLKENNLLPLPKIIDPHKFCKRTLCVVLQNVKRTVTPKWMADRLTQVEMNIHDSAIDITNYVTHELGHPIHAFDYDRIMALGGEIHVTEAKKGEAFVTLDGELHSCVGGEIVFKNSKGEIIDLPAIKGTANSSVNADTKNILLWIESLEPSKIRFASMSHAIRTVAAQLSEKGIDPHLAEPTFVRAIELYQDLCEATVASKIHDDFSGEEQPQPIIFDKEKIDIYLGLEIEKERIVEILKKLECKVEVIRNTFHIVPPTFRKDLQIPADIVEEIARIHGYHNLPSVLMPTKIPLTKPKDLNFSAEETIKHFLADRGWFEIYTYSMVSEKIAQQSGFQITRHLQLANSLTEDKVYLRRSLSPSLQETIANNPQVENLSVFELANVYHPQENELPNETMLLSLVSQKPLAIVKGDFEALLRKFYLTKPVVKQKNGESYGEILVDSIKIGRIWLENNLTCIEIELAILLPLVKQHPNYQPLPKTSSIKESLTFTLPVETQIGPVIDEIAGLSQYIKSVTLEDVYQQNCSFGIEYWDQKKNLANENIKPLREKVVAMVTKQFNGKLVGKL